MAMRFLVLNFSTSEEKFKTSGIKVYNPALWMNIKEIGNHNIGSIFNFGGMRVNKKMRLTFYRLPSLENFYLICTSSLFFYIDVA